VRDAIAEKEQLLAETHRVRTMLRAALDIVSEGAPEAGETQDEARPTEIQRLAG
jgi:hypothetical protein